MNCRPLRDRTVRCIVAIPFGLTLWAAPTWVLAQTPDPLDANAPITSTTYQSPLADFRAFDPDESMQSWVDANRRVNEIGGWRTYLRQANPPKKSARKAQQPAKPASAMTPSPEPEKPMEQAAASAATEASDESKPAVTVQTESSQSEQKQPEPDKLTRQEVAAVSSPPKDKVSPPPVTEIPALAEGGNNQRDEIQLTQPNLPDQFSRGECPRVLTGLRLPVDPRIVALTQKTQQLLLRVTKCFRTRSYIVGGHTDGRGPLSANQALSQSRADAVRRFLVANGVDPQRITSRGYGETRPIDTNRTKRGRARNRRIDFTLGR